MPKILLDTATNISIPDVSKVDATDSTSTLSFVRGSIQTFIDKDTSLLSLPVLNNETDNSEIEDTEIEVGVSSSLGNIGTIDTSNMIATIVPTPRKTTNDRYRRMRRSNFQARLGRKLDIINNRIIDNDIRITAHPTDMIRVEAVRDERSGDLISRVIKSTEVMPILLPKMVDIPLRHLIRENRDVLVPSLYSISQEEYFEVYAPVECDLNEDDLLIRILYDSSPEVSDPYILVLQVKDILGTLGYSSILWKKCVCSLYDEVLPEKVVLTLKECIKKREILNW